MSKQVLCCSDERALGCYLEGKLIHYMHSSLFLAEFVHVNEENVKIKMSSESSHVPSTQGKHGTSQMTYSWVILFVWDMTEEFPFSILPLRHFDKCEDFPKELITGPLTDEEGRVKKFRLKNVPGKAHSVFCKIQQGKG